MFLSLKAPHIPGLENRAAGLMSRGGPLPDEWWFSLALQDNPPLGVDMFAHMAKIAAGRNPASPLRLILPLLERVRRERLSVILVAPGRRLAPWYAEMTQIMVGQPGLSDKVIQSIQAAGAGSSPARYRPKWLGFQRWCEERNLESLSCTLGSILSYLQLLVYRGLAHSTVKVYAAAISSWHKGFGGRSAFSQPLMSRFLQGSGASAQ